MTARTFRLPLTLFNTFNIFPRTGFGPLSPVIRSIGNSGGEPQSILQEMNAWKEGFVRPQGTILKLMRIIETMKSN